MTITINFENLLWFLIFALAQQECIQFYQGVEKACCRYATHYMIPVLYRVFERYIPDCYQKK